MSAVNAALAQGVAAWSTFDAQAETWSRDVALFLHPGFPYDERATRDWPLTRLSAALAIAAAYLLLVAYGILRRGGSSEDVEDAAGKKLGFFAGLRKEPIKLLQIVYNSVQVVLCCWMMAAAASQAYGQGYSLVCNKFDPRDTRMASVEYVFYLSKVRGHAPEWIGQPTNYPNGLVCVGGHCSPLSRCASEREVTP